MAKIKLRRYITEGFGEHLKNNYGKYLAGAAAGATGGVYAGGQGVLGDDIKTNIQDLGYKAAADLYGRGFSNNSIENSFENPILSKLGEGQQHLARGIMNFSNADDSAFNIGDRNPEATENLKSRIQDSIGNDAAYLVNRLHRALSQEN